MVLFLLEKGSFAEAEDERGKTPKDVASSIKIKDLIEDYQQRSYICMKPRLPSQGFAAEASRFLNFWSKENLKK